MSATEEKPSMDPASEIEAHHDDTKTTNADDADHKSEGSNGFVHVGNAKMATEDNTNVTEFSIRIPSDKHAHIYYDPEKQGAGIIEDAAEPTAAGAGNDGHGVNGTDDHLLTCAICKLEKIESTVEILLGFHVVLLLLWTGSFIKSYSV